MIVDSWPFSYTWDFHSEILTQLLIPYLWNLSFFWKIINIENNGSGWCGSVE